MHLQIVFGTQSHEAFSRRKREAREAHKSSAVAQKAFGLKAKILHAKRHAEKVQMKKTLKAHDERNVKQKDSAAVPEGALPTYLLDREGQKDAKALSTAIKEKRKDKAKAVAAAVATERTMQAALKRTKPVLISGSLDNTIKVWDLASGKCQQTLFGHIEGVWAVASDKLRLVSGSHDRTIKVSCCARWFVACGVRECNADQGRYRRSGHAWRDAVRRRSWATAVLSPVSRSAKTRSCLALTTATSESGVSAAKPSTSSPALPSQCVILYIFPSQSQLLSMYAVVGSSSVCCRFVGLSHFSHLTFLSSLLSIIEQKIQRSCTLH